MPRRTDTALIAAMIVAAAVFCGVIAGLMMVRFGAGKDFPPYSTLRSDPLGAKALYTAFQNQPNLSVQRFHRQVKEIGQIPPAGRGAGKTVLFLGATDSADRRQDIEALNQFASSGGRVVVAFYPTTSEEKAAPAKKDRQGKKPPSKEELEPKAPWQADMVNVTDIWKFRFAYSDRPETQTSRGFIQFNVQNDDYPALAPILPWHSSMYFDELAEQWKTVYGWRNKNGDLRSVVIERPWGSGTLALCSDTFLLSNEAMQTDRHPDFLAWLAGPSTTLLFDEAHLGAAYRSGMMELVRKYRLHGIVFTLVAVALLFVWKNASSLVPRRQVVSSETRARTTQGAPLANLLRHHIPPAKLLPACIDEWSKDVSGTQNASVTADQRERIHQATDEMINSGAHIAQIYATICKVLAERKPQRERTD